MSEERKLTVEELLRRDRDLYGSSFEMKTAQGEVVRIDPRDITIRVRDRSEKRPEEPPHDRA